MAEPVEPEELPEANDLQFTTVEPAAGDAPAAPAAPSCVACKQPIADAYYSAGGKLVCPRCRDSYVAARERGSRVGRLAKATALGIGAGFIGALIWYGVRKLTGYEVGLIAVVVGLMVGGAVRAGSGRRGGRGYQVLALVLTYGSICLNYMPDIFQALWKEAQQHHAAVQPVAARTGVTAVPGGANAGSAAPAATPAAAQPPRPRPGLLKIAGLVILLLIIMFALALAAPVLAGMQNLIGLLIIGFALWEAWKINSGRQVVFSGPFSLRSGAGAAPGVTS